MEANPRWVERPEVPEEPSLKRAFRRGDPFVWLTGGALSLALLMVVGILVLIGVSGFSALWPERLTRLELADGSAVLGSVSATERTPGYAGSGDPRRVLLRVGNRDLYGYDFKWYAMDEVRSRTHPADVFVVSRLEWGPFYGKVSELRTDGRILTGSAAETFLAAALRAAEERRKGIERIEKDRIGEINGRIEALRNRLRKLELRGAWNTAEGRSERDRIERGTAELESGYGALTEELGRLRDEDAKHVVVLETMDGMTKELSVSHVVRAYPANRLSLPERAGVFAANLWEFVSADPRESNTEGGVFPAIFGTVLMTLLMTLLVVPFGVLAALYLREYARQGALVSAVRIAVNNLAGVPSIVFGVFGLGFFVYTLGGSIDALFYPERLPNPTFGSGGILWASLTLALLTVPVVIVATEEALASVPTGMRDGSIACGASKFQTLWRIVLPSAAPGIMTGAILAMARGAGEVAPLMITGVVKLAPTLPLDGEFPFLHLERRFMHLGFHIYDVGFQSPNVEAAKPMVYATAFLLIVVVVLLNLTAIVVRNRLRRKYRSAND